MLDDLPLRFFPLPLARWLRESTDVLRKIPRLRRQSGSGRAEQRQVIDHRALSSIERLAIDRLAPFECPQRVFLLGKAPMRRRWRMQRGAFEAAPRFSGVNSARESDGATMGKFPKGGVLFSRKRTLPFGASSCASCAEGIGDYTSRKGQTEAPASEFRRIAAMVTQLSSVAPV